MKDTHDDELEGLMRDWAARQAALDEKLEDLARRISERLSELPKLDEVVISPRQSSRRMLGWVMAAGTIAASLAVLAYVGRPFGSSVSSESKEIVYADRGDADARRLTPIGGQELAEKARLAQEFQQEFPGRFVWLMETGNEMKVGLSSDENAQPSRFIAVRFVVESQGPNDRVWKPVRALDFLTLSEETVETSLASNHGASVAIWTYKMPDGMISVDSELTLTGPVPIRVSSSRLISSGTPTEIWQSEQDGVKYRIYQAAEVVDNEQLG